MTQAQPSLFETPGAEQEPSPARIRAFAGFLAGWKWPGHGSYNSLSAKRRKAAEQAAREVLRTLATGDDE